jgi:hypothetical protein
MSGLEPVVALALACNVFQVIGVTRETIRIVKQVYRYGDLDPALTDHATRLDDLSERIQTAMMPTTPAAATTTTTPTMTAPTTARGAAHGATQQVAI